MSSTWYGKSASKHIEALIQTKSKLHHFLAIPQFIQQLKSYSSKLLDYITNNPGLISEAICYLTLAPQPSDSNDRKYKLPLQVIEIIQTETTCVLNGFFKQGEIKDTLNIDLLYSMLDQSEVLPLLAGYFFRTNLCLLNNRYKQTIARIYDSARIFHNLINHSEHMAISNTIQLFLNLDINKNSTSHPDKLAIKLQAISAILKKIQLEHRIRAQNSASIIENLCSVLIETVDKYYLILDGNQMIEVITNSSSIEIMVSLIRQNSQMAFPAFNFFISLINYYSFSSFSADQVQNSDLARKNAEKLQSQPMIIEMLKFFPQAMDKISRCSKMDLYHYKLLEVLCHCISISSMRIFKKVCDVKFFACLINLLFKHEQNNILHMLIQKSFYHVFISERKIYEQYKKHLFCELDIIDITVNRMLKLCREDHFLDQAKLKPFFGHFMRILKIYSGIQPTDEKIIAAIKSKTAIWNKISQILIKPYQTICFKELGSYDNTPNPVYQEFVIKRQNNVSESLHQNNNAILQIEKEEQFPLVTTAHPVKKEDNGQHSYLFDCQPANLNMKIQNLPLVTEQKSLKKSESFKDFMSKKKVEVGHQIKIKRSQSQQKKLSNSNQKRMSSPSPTKINSWREKQEKPQHKIGSSSSSKEVPVIPKVPLNRRTLGNKINGTANDKEDRFEHEQRRTSKSVSLEEIKKFRIVMIDPPRQKRYRKVDEKDRILLDFLGISV